MELISIRENNGSKSSSYSKFNLSKVLKKLLRSSLRQRKTQTGKTKISLSFQTTKLKEISIMKLTLK